MSDEVVGTMIDKGIVIRIVENEDWDEVRRYLKELRRDLRRGFERLNECLTCPANAVLCAEVERLVESYNRAFLAVLTLKCLLNEALRVVEDEGTRGRLNEVLKVTDDLASFLNEKHGLIQELVEKCKSVWGDSK